MFLLIPFFIGRLHILTANNDLSNSINPDNPNFHDFLGNSTKRRRTKITKEFLQFLKESLIYFSYHHYILVKDSSGMPHQHHVFFFSPLCAGKVMMLQYSTIFSCWLLSKINGTIVFDSEMQIITACYHTSQNKRYSALICWS